MAAPIVLLLGLGALFALGRRKAPAGALGSDPLSLPPVVPPAGVDPVAVRLAADRFLAAPSPLDEPTLTSGMHLAVLLEQLGDTQRSSAVRARLVAERAARDGAGILAEIAQQMNRPAPVPMPPGVSHPSGAERAPSKLTGEAVPSPAVASKPVPAASPSTSAEEIVRMSGALRERVREVLSGRDPVALATLADVLDRRGYPLTAARARELAAVLRATAAAASATPAGGYVERPAATTPAAAAPTLPPVVADLLATLARGKGSEDQSIVRRYQKTRGLGVDGLYGPQSARALAAELRAAGSSQVAPAPFYSGRGSVAPSTSSATAPTPTEMEPLVAEVLATVGRGRSNEDQEIVRRYQISRGLGADGKYGRRTAAALRADVLAQAPDRLSEVPAGFYGSKGGAK